MKVTPDGSAPVSVIVGAGFPLAVTVKVPAAPTLKVAELAEVMVGATWTVFTVKVNAWVASGAVPLVAVMVIGYVPLDPMIGVPDSTPVVELRVTPVGSVPVSLKVGAGKPVAVTAKVPAVPTVKVAALPEVMTGAWSTVTVKLWVASGAIPLVAVDGDRV